MKGIRLSINDSQDELDTIIAIHKKLSHHLVRKE